MLSENELKRMLQLDLSRADKVLLVLASFEQPTRIGGLKERAEQVGCRMKTWNIADILAKAKGTTIRLPNGYEVAEKGRAKLHSLGVTKLGPHAARITSDLRSHLGKVSDETTRAFVEEAIQCFEAGLHRSAIVMGWLAAVAALQREVVSNHLEAFNVEAKRVDPKWKAAKTADDLGRLKESDFLDRLAAISIIGKNVKAELMNALNLRNGCGHPNSLKVGANRVAGHLEALLLNVFERFSV